MEKIKNLVGNDELLNIIEILSLPGSCLLCFSCYKICIHAVLFVSILIGASSYHTKGTGTTASKDNSYFPLKTFVTFETANPQQIIGRF